MSAIMDMFHVDNPEQAAKLAITLTAIAIGVSIIMFAISVMKKHHLQKKIMFSCGDIQTLRAFPRDSIVRPRFSGLSEALLIVYITFFFGRRGVSRPAAPSPRLDRLFHATCHDANASPLPDPPVLVVHARAPCALVPS